MGTAKVLAPSKYAPIENATVPLLKATVTYKILLIMNLHTETCCNCMYKDSRVKDLKKSVFVCYVLEF